MPEHSPVLPQDGYGMMLIRLERLLALGCLTRRTLVLPAKTFKALQSLVDLPALEAAGYCLVPDASPWQVKKNAGAPSNDSGNGDCPGVCLNCACRGTELCRTKPRGPGHPSWH